MKIHHNTGRTRACSNLFFSLVFLCFGFLCANQSSATENTQPIFYNPATEIIFDQIEAYNGFDLSKMNETGTNYQIVAEKLIEKKGSLISRLLGFSIPEYTCSLIDSQPTIVFPNNVEPIDKSSAGLLKRWEALIDGDFVALSLFSDLELLKKSIEQSANSLERRSTNCASLALAVSTLQCFQSSKKDCHVTYFEKRKQLEAFELPKFDNEIQTLFSHLKPFLALSGSEHLKRLLASGHGYDEDALSLTEIFKEALRDSIDSYQSWYSSEQIALLLEEHGGWLQDLLGLTQEEKQLIKELHSRHKKIDEAMLSYLEGKIGSDNETLIEEQSTRALLTYYTSNLSTYNGLKDSVLSKVKSLKTDGSIVYQQAKNAVQDANDIAKAKLNLATSAAPKLVEENLNKLFKLYVDLEPNGKLTTQGRPLNKATLFLFSNVTKQSFVVPGCMSIDDKVPTSCAKGAANANPLIDCDADNQNDCSASHDAGVNIDLGVSVDNILLEADGSYSFYCAPGASCINSQASISRESLTKLLESIGVPPLVPIINEGKIYIDRNLKNLSYEIDLNPFGGLLEFKPLRLKVIESGSVITSEKIGLAIADHVKKEVIPKGLEAWLYSMPFIKEAGAMADQLFAFNLNGATPLRVEYIVTEGSDIPRAIEVIVPVNLASSDSDLQSLLGTESYDISVVINQQGAYIRANTIPKKLYANLQSVASSYINKLLSPLKTAVTADLININVNPVFESRFNRIEMALLLSYSIDSSGCASGPQILRLVAPFSDISKQVKGVFDNANEIVAKCFADGLIKKATIEIQNQEITLFGIKTKIVEGPSFDSGLGEAIMSVQIADADTGISAVLKNVTAKASGSKFEIDFSTADWDHDDTSTKVGAIIQNRIESIFGGSSDYFSMKDTRLSRDGFSFELLVHDLPYVGNYNLGRIYLNALSDLKIVDILKREIKPKLTSAVNHALKENIDIPDLGPITDLSPIVEFEPDDQLALNANATLQLYSGVTAPIEIGIFPKPHVKVPEGKQIAIAAITSLLTDVIPLSVGPFTFMPTPTQVQYFPNIGAYGVPFGFKVDVGIIKVEVLGIKITPKRFTLPDSISARLSSPIPIPPFIVIADPGFTYYINKKGLTIDGAITIIEQSVAKVVNIDSKIGLKDLKDLTFVLEGKLIAASSFPLYEAFGEISLKQKRLEYRAGTSELLKPIIESKGEGLLDGENRKAVNSTSIRILGIHIANDELSLLVPESMSIEDGVLTFGGSQNLLIGTFSYDLSSDLRFKNPGGTASASIELGGWNAMRGALALNLYRAKLDFKALGINVKVIAPSIKSISPRLLLRILADLLKVDIKSLMKMDLDEIVINLMDSDGKVDEQNSKPPECDQPSCGAPPGPPPEPGPTPPPPLPVPPTPPCTEGCPSPVPWVEEEPLVKGHFACFEQLIGRYEFKRIFGSDISDKGHKHSGMLQEIRDWHPVTFGQEQAEMLCRGYKLTSQWKPVSARQSINYRQFDEYECDSDNQLNISVTPRAKATWNEYGHGYFCGSATNGVVPGYKQIREFDVKGEIEHDDWLALERGEPEFDQAKYLVLLRQEFDKVLGELTEVGTPILGHENTRLEFKRVGFFCFTDCKRKATLYVYSDPKSAVHEWRQAFHLLYKDGEFWYLSMCEDPKMMEKYINVNDPVYKSLCRTTLTSFNTKLSDLGLEGSRADFDAGKVWLEPEEYYFLLEKRAVKHFTGQPMDAKLTDSFLLNKSGKNYTAQMMSIGNSSTPPLEFFIFSKESGTEAKNIRVESKDPLYQWMKHPFKGKILGFLMDELPLNVALSDISKNELVLIDERSLSDRRKTHALTYWFALRTVNGKDSIVSKTLLIEKRSPYTKRLLHGGEYRDLFKHYFNNVIANDWTHLDFGTDMQLGNEVNILSNTNSINVYLSLLSKGRKLGDPTVSRSGPKWQRVLTKLGKTECFGSSNRAAVIDILTEPEAYYPLRMDTHPFSILGFDHCL